MKAIQFCMDLQERLTNQLSQKEKDRLVVMNWFFLLGPQHIKLCHTKMGSAVYYKRKKLGDYLNREQSVFYGSTIDEIENRIKHLTVAIETDKCKGQNIDQNYYPSEKTLEKIKAAGISDNRMHWELDCFLGYHSRHPYHNWPDIDALFTLWVKFSVYFEAMEFTNEARNKSIT